MNQFTPAQQKAIQTWTEQRDALHREIGIASVELEQLQKSTQEKGLALADLHQSIAESRGRLAELTALEERHRGSVVADVAELEVRKSRLEGECSLLEEKSKAAADKYAVVTMATIDLQSAHDTMKDQSAIVDRVVGEIIQTSILHTSDMKTIMAEIKAISDEVISKSNSNIEQANIVLPKLTRHIVDFQRPIPVRRTYPPGHPNAPKEE